jgi:hypothetical protein
MALTDMPVGTARILDKYGTLRHDVQCRSQDAGFNRDNAPVFASSSANCCKLLARIPSARRCIAGSSKISLLVEVRAGHISALFISGEHTWHRLIWSCGYETLRLVEANIAQSNWFHRNVWNKTRELGFLVVPGLVD